MALHLDPPNPPFVPGRRNSTHSSSGTSYNTPLSPSSPLPSPTRSRDGSPAPHDHRLSAADSSMSLSVNYLPAKFSSGMLSPTGPRRRPPRRGTDDSTPTPGLVPKMGGGVDAFKSGESRMGGPGDDDDDDSSPWQAVSHKSRKTKLKWNKFKWILFVANLILTIYTLVGLVFCLLTWFNVFKRADIIRVGNHTELVISTLACVLGVLTAMIGWAGILMNNRSFLAIYTFTLWIVFVFILVPGYLSYKRRTFNLEGKINAQWSKGLGAVGRLRIQNELSCCGYFSPFIEATISQTCYARSILPGCKLGYIVFEREALKRWYTIAFSLVPIHLAIMVAGLLCSNHVTYRFGKGMMPKAYRLSMTTMAVIMDNYASQLAEQYGADIATDILAQSRSNLHLDTMNDTGSAQTSVTKFSGMGKLLSGVKYNSLNSKMPKDS